MAKSIRSKAKRKLRAVKREKIAAKERLKLIALKEQEEGIKMVEDEGQVQQEDTNASTSGDVSTPGENDNEVIMEVTSDNQTKDSEKKSFKNSRGKKVKCLGKKKKMKYKW